MIIGVLCWIIIFAVAYVVISYKVREHNARRGMMDHVQRVHGHLDMTVPVGERVGSTKMAGYSISENSDMTTYYTSEDGSKVTGFMVVFCCDAPVDGAHVIYANSISLKDQEDPYWKYPSEQRTGVLSFTKDKNGKVYYVDYTPDP